MRQTHKPCKDATAARKARPVFEELESRLLLSADLAGVAPDTASQAEPAVVQQIEQEIAQTAPTASTAEAAVETRRELVIIDPRVPDYGQLVADMLAPRADGREIEVLVVDPMRDGIAQLSEALTARHDLSALHVISHGAAGQFSIGGTLLDFDSLLANATAIQQWGEALTGDADIMLYGCDVAASADGRQLVDALGRLTGADVTASDDPTGHSLLGGDWKLEYATGAIETNVAVSGTAQANWQNLLAFTAQGGETRVNTTTAGVQQTAYQFPQVAMDENGNYIVVWEDTALDGSGYGIYAQRYDASGVAQGGEFRVNTTTADHQAGPSVGMDANGNFVVAWASNLQDGSGYGIYAQRFDASGVAQGSEFRVNANTTGDQLWPTVTMNASGNFIVSWTSNGQDGSGQGGYAQRFDASGVAQGSEFRINTYTAGDQIIAFVAMNASGDFIATWTSDGQDGSSYGAYAQRYNASGVAQGGEFRVNTTTTGVQGWSTAAIDASGNFIVAWISDGQDGSGFGVYAQRYNAAGVAQGSEFRVNTTTANNEDAPMVAMTGSGFAVVWQSDLQDSGTSGIYMRQYDLDGTALTGEIRVNTTSAGSQTNPSLAVDNNGHLTVIWSGNGTGDASGVFMQRYLYSPAPPASADVTVTTNEDTAYTLSVANFSFTDPDAGDSLSAVRIDTLPAAGNLTLSGVAVSANDVIAVADITAGNLVFTPVANANGSAYASFTFSVRDQSSLNDVNPNTLTINVTAVNDAPAGTDNTVTTNEDIAHVFTAANFGFTDVDAGDSLSAVRIDTLPGAGSLTLSGVAMSAGDVIAVADITAGNLVFTPAANGNGAGYASFTFSVRDQSSSYDATPNTLTVNVTAVNDAPAGTNNTVTTNEDTAHVFTAANFGFTDIDAGDSLSAVRIDTLPSTGNLTLSGVAVSANDVIAVTDITAGNLVFTPAANANGAGYASFTFSVRDQSSAYDATPNTLTVDVTAVNDAPAGTNNTVTTNEDSAHVFTVANFGFTDIDAGDSLSAVRIDTLPAAGSLTLSGVAVNAGDVIVLADITAGNLVFTPAANANGAGYANFTFSVRDQSNAYDATPNTLTVNVTAVNDAPAGTNNTVTTNEDTAHVFTAANFGFTDVDAGDSLSAVRIDTLPGAGSLTLSGAAVNAGDVISAADITAGKLVFTPAANANGAGYASFTFSVRDQGSAYDATPNTLTVNVTAVNDAPVIDTNNGMTLVSGASGTLTSSELAVSDADSAATQLVYTLTSAPGAGVLMLNGTALNTGNTFTQADVNANRVTYQHTDASMSSDSFGFTVTDGAGGNAGPSSFAITATLTMPPTVIPPDPAVIPPAPVPPPVPVPLPGESSANPVAPLPVVSAPAPEVLYISTNRGVPLATPAAREFAAPPATTTESPAENIPGEAVRVANPQPVAQSFQALGAALDELRRDLNQDDTPLIVHATTSGGAVLTVGFVAWLLRSGALVSSLMATAPLWNRFDPVPVLARRRESDEERKQDIKDRIAAARDHGERRLRKLFQTSPLPGN